MWSGRSCTRRALARVVSAVLVSVLIPAQGVPAFDSKRVASYHPNITRMLRGARARDGVVDHFARLDLDRDGSITARELRSELAAPGAAAIYEGTSFDHLGDSYYQLLRALHQAHPRLKDEGICGACPMSMQPFLCFLIILRFGPLCFLGSIIL